MFISRHHSTNIGRGQKVVLCLVRGIQHTLLNTELRTAGILAATITVLLSLFLGLALWQFILEWRRGEAAWIVA